MKRWLRGALKTSAEAIAALGGAVVPLGVFAVLVVGVHAGTDRVDDYVFSFLNAVDILVDSAAAVVVETLLGWRRGSAEQIARLTFAIQDFVDLDAKHRLSRFLALAIEIVSDIALAVPLFVHRARAYSLSTVWYQLMTDPTVLRVAGPLAVFFAGAAGTLLVAQEVQVGVHGWLVQYARYAPSAEAAARTVAILAALLVAWRLGVIAVRRSVSLAEERAQRDHRMMSRTSKRRSRGLFIAVVVLPVSVLGLFEAVPRWSVVKALFGG